MAEWTAGYLTVPVLFVLMKHIFFMASVAAFLALACHVPASAQDAYGRLLFETATAVSADTARAAAALREGNQALTERRWGAAITSFAEARIAFPAISDWTAALSAVATANQGDVEATTQYAEMAGAHLRRERTWRSLVEVHLNNGEYPDAIATGEGLLPTIPGEAERARIHVMIADAHARTNNDPGVVRSLMNAIGAGVTTPGAREAADRLRRLKVTSRPEIALAVATVWLGQNRATDAYNLLGGVSADAGDPAIRPLIEDAGSRMARAGNCSRANGVAGVLRQTDSADAHYRNMAYEIGGCHYRAGNRPAATSILQAIGTGSDTPASRANYVLAEVAHDEGRLSEAFDLYTQAIRNPHTHRPVALARIASLGILSQRHSAAEAALQRFLSTTSHIGDSQVAAYWMGRVRQENRNPTGAADMYRVALNMDSLSYYGFRAAQRLGEKILLPARPDPRGDALSTALVDGGILRWRVLQSAGLTGEATVEVALLRALLRDRGEGALLDLADTFHSVGETFSGVSVAREAERMNHGPSVRLLRSIYPFPYREAVLASTRRVNLDVSLVAGLIRQESMFNPDALSSAGAAGLMQVMPATAAQMARELGLSYQRSRLFDPEYNSRLGTAYLASMIRTHQGRTDEVLAAYNAGPTRVRNWRGFPEHADPDMWIERIPFAETREYAKVVQRNGWLYQLLHDLP